MQGDVQEMQYMAVKTWNARLLNQQTGPDASQQQATKPCEAAHQAQASGRAPSQPSARLKSRTPFS